MPGIQANGVGSGLDISGLVSQLVAAEAAPFQQRITRHEVAVTSKISALGTLKGALSAFRSALEPLKSVTAFQTRTASSGDSKIFSASADTTAVTGHYDIEVVQLAKAHQLASAAFAGGSASTVGYGSLTIAVGSDSFNVTIAQDAATLADIRDAINDSPDNTGVQATLLNGVAGTKLVLTSADSGAANTLKVTASGGDGGLNQLVYDPPGTTNLTQLQPAQDALIRIAGSDVSSATNVFANAIDGVTITALAGSAGATVALDVTFDSAAVQSRIQNFVTQYNSMQAQLAKLGSYNAQTKQAGPLLGDALLRAIESDTRRSLSDPVPGLSGDYTTLASLGITTTVTGALEIDSTKLTKALDADAGAIAKLFGSEDGVAARLYSQMDARLASEGDIEGRTSRLGNELKDIDADKQALTLRMAQVEARYRKQFTALDTLLAQMQSTSSYLSQQLANLPKIGE